MEKHPDISFEDLVDYAYELLPRDKEAAFEDLLDEHEDYARMADALLDYCLDNQLKTKAALLAHLEGKRNAFLEKIGFPQQEAKPPVDKPNTIRRLIYWSSAAAAVLLIVFGLYNWLSQPGWNLDVNTIMAEGVEELSPQLGDASSNEWKTYLVLDKDYPKALEALMEDAEGRPIDSLFYLNARFIGQLKLYLNVNSFNKMEIQEAVKYLEAGSIPGSLSTERHLLFAYLLLGDKQKADDLLSDTGLQLEEQANYVKEAYYRLED